MPPAKERLGLYAATGSHLAKRGNQKNSDQNQTVQHSQATVKRGQEKGGNRNKETPATPALCGATDHQQTRYHHTAKKDHQPRTKKEVTPPWQGD